MSSSETVKVKRAKVADIIVGVVLFLAIVFCLMPKNAGPVTNSSASAGMNGINEQQMRFTPDTVGQPTH